MSANHSNGAQNDATANNEYGTPYEVIEPARKVLGVIDLDVASCLVANRNIVKARNFYHKGNSALDDENEWHGNVWANPPYSRIISKFCAKMRQQVEAGNVKQAICLTNNGTETHWLKDLHAVASATCMIDKRLSFIDLTTGQPKTKGMKGQLLTYIGDHPDRFYEAFKHLGRVWVPYSEATK